MPNSTTQPMVDRARKRRGRRRLLAALTATLVVLTACGSTDDSSQTAEPTPEQQEQLDKMPPLDLDRPTTTKDTADIPAREVDSVLPTSTQLAQDFPDPVSLLGEYLEISTASLLEGDEILLSSSASGTAGSTVLKRTATDANVQYLTDRPVEAETDRLAAEISAPWELEEDSTRTIENGIARELTYSAAGGSTNSPDSLRVVVAPSKEMAGTVVQIIEFVYTDGEALPDAPSSLVGYEEEFGFEAPTSCIATRWSLALSTYNPQVPLKPSIIATWTCPGIDAATLRSAVTTAMQTDPRFEAEPWGPSGDDQLAQFMHGEANGQWRVTLPTPPSSPDPGLQLSLDAPTI